ncbi:hypothetical protein [Fusibacter tunisiensis]|uniref:Uncharacterized protein n=1 Tax=Fusibacter tunisiensis TaxID=1008308 RepID=A0ABS2MTL0_9FIRM|nr:hypothetical protein [Fusibacter tunisiensis]MBM7562713.1 hypothetical protein [Fusibacter tunisiensis]
MSYSEEVVIRIESKEKELNFKDEIFVKLAERVGNELNEYVLSENFAYDSRKNYVVYSIDEMIYGGGEGTSEFIEDLIKEHGGNYRIGIYCFSDEGFHYYSEFLDRKHIKLFVAGQVLVDLYPLESESFMSSTNYLSFNEEDRTSNLFFKSKDCSEVEKILGKYDFIDFENPGNMLGTSVYLDYETKISFAADLHLVSDIIKPYGLSLAYSITCFDRDLNVEQIVEFDEKFEYRHMKFGK